MSQISRRQLDKSLENRLYEIFWNALAKINNKEGVSAFLSDVFTPTEKLMISKRLAIALLLNRGWSQEAIRDILKVSTTTVQTIKSNLRWRGNGYRQVISRIETDEEWGRTASDLTELLQGMFTGQVSKSVFVRGFHNKYRKKPVL